MRLAERLGKQARSVTRESVSPAPRRCIIARARVFAFNFARASRMPGPRETEAGRELELELANG